MEEQQQNILAEGFSVGYMIMYPEMIDRQKITLDLFLSPAYRGIVSCLHKLSEKNKDDEIDTMAVFNYCKNTEWFKENFASEQDLLKCIATSTDNIPHDFSFDNAISILSELRDKRSIKEITKDAHKLVSDKNTTTQEAVAYIEKQIEEKITKKAAPHEQTSFNSYDLASDYFAYIENSIDNNEYNPDDIIKIGFPEMDNDMFFERGQQVVIAARQNMGKSSLAIDMINRLRKSGRRVVFFSFEMKKKLVTARLLSCESQIPSNFIQFKGRPLYPQERLIIEDILASQIMFHDNFDLHTPYDLVTTDYIKKILKQMKKEGRPADVFLVDHIGLMKYTGKSDGEMGVEIGNNAMLLRKMAQEFNCLNIILSHITKEGASGKMPQMHHIAGSDKISRHSDVVLLLHRDDYYMDPDEAAKKGIKGVAKIWAAKVRDGTGNLYKYQYRGDISRFEPIKSAILGGG